SRASSRARCTWTCCATSSRSTPTSPRSPTPSSTRRAPCARAACAATARPPWPEGKAATGKGERPAPSGAGRCRSGRGDALRSGGASGHQLAAVDLDHLAGDVAAHRRGGEEDVGADALLRLADAPHDDGL